jgi:prophage antirepressor-like protein
MSNDLITFHFKDISLNAVEIAGEPWFVLVDVCRVLEIANSRNATARLDEDEKGVHNVDTLGGAQDVTIISESGLYRLVLTSRKPQAKPFQKWVTTDVIPSIRKTGKYAFDQPQGPSPREERLTRELLSLQRKYIDLIQEVDFYRQRAGVWTQAEQLVLAGVDDETICRTLDRPAEFVALVRHKTMNPTCPV